MNICIFHEGLVKHYYRLEKSNQARSLTEMLNFMLVLVLTRNQDAHLWKNIVAHCFDYFIHSKKELMTFTLEILSSTLENDNADSDPLILLTFLCVIMAVKIIAIKWILSFNLYIQIPMYVVDFKKRATQTRRGQIMLAKQRKPAKKKSMEVKKNTIPPIRITQEEKELIYEASALSGQTISQFVVNNILRVSQNVLSKQTLLLGEKDYAEIFDENSASMPGKNENLKSAFSKLSSISGK